jgi:hypothetical protein
LLTLYIICYTVNESHWNNENRFARLSVQVTVRRVVVILIAAKNLAWMRGADEILRCAQNDDISPPGKRLRVLRTSEPPEPAEPQ